MSSLTLAPLSNLDVGAVLALGIAVVAFRAHALDAGGAIAAFVVGTATYGALGVAGGVVLLTFFVTSIGLSRYGKARKRSLLIDVGKTGPRDAAQVLANGGVAALCAVLAHTVDARFTFAFAGAFAAATADTWGTEIGTLARGAPRSILTGKRIAAGLSGGVTIAGSIAEVAGALVIGAVSPLLGAGAFVPALCGGIAGALADSALGASLQSLRWCPNCKRATEREPHVCGANTTPIRGATWLGNDGVNAAATLAGALVGFAIGPRG